MIRGYVRILLGAELVICLPATWRYKHYTREENEELAEELARRMGGSFLSLEEEDDQEA